MENETDLKEKAIKDFTKRIKLNPIDYTEYYNRGTTYVQLGKYDEAIIDFNKAIELNPIDYAEYYNRGLTYASLKQYDDAIKDFSISITLNPMNYFEYHYRGKAFNSLKKYEDAILDFTKAIDLNPVEDEYLSRGRAYVSCKKYEEAIDDYNKAIKLNEANYIAYNYRGIAYYLLERYKEAIDNFSKANELNQKDYYAYYFRGIAYAAMKNHKEAIEYYKKAIKLDPNNDAAYYFRGIAYHSLKKYKQTVNDLNMTIRLNQSRCNAYFLRGIAHNYLLNYEKAINDFNHYIELNKYQKDERNRGRSAIGDTYLLYESKTKNKEAAVYFNKAGKDPIEILAYCQSIEQMEEVASIMLEENRESRFNQITSTFDAENKKLYQLIYIDILKIIYSLSIKIDEKTFFSHYTTRNVAAQMILNKSLFRLSSILTTNDPKEGETIFDYLAIKKDTEKDENGDRPDYQAFIGCFSFNQNNLNQFRLYGKENTEEATGVDLILNKDFFNPDVCANIWFPNHISDMNGNQSQEDDLIKDNKERIKYPIFRCLYIDPQNSKVVSIGHSDKAPINANTYKKVEKLLKEIKDQITNNNSLKKAVLSDLLLPLRYLVKHAAFKEEQECRIICIKDMEKDKDLISFTPDYSQMYIEYQKIGRNCLEEIIFGPKAKGIDIFKNALKQKEIVCKCNQSELPFA